MAVSGASHVLSRGRNILGASAAGRVLGYVIESTHPSGLAKDSLICRDCAGLLVKEGDPA
jgi:hypothetical protein